MGKRLLPSTILRISAGVFIGWTILFYIFGAPERTFRRGRHDKGFRPFAFKMPFVYPIQDLALYKQDLWQRTHPDGEVAYYFNASFWWPFNMNGMLNAYFHFSLITIGLIAYFIRYQSKSSRRSESETEQEHRKAVEMSYVYLVFGIIAIACIWAFLLYLFFSSESITSWDILGKT
jgi:hypothetical protein